MSPVSALPHTALVVGSRIFAFLVIGAPVLWSRDVDAVVGLVAVGATWLLCSAFVRSPVPVLVLGTTEAVLIGLVVGYLTTASSGLLLALAIPPLAAGLWRGARGVLESVLLLSVSLVAAVVVTHRETSANDVADLFTWVVTGAGVGLLASLFTRITRQVPDTTEPYREARALIRELTALSSHLTGGLDATALGGDILDRVARRVPASDLHLHVNHHDDFVALLSRSPDPDQASAAPMALVTHARHTDRPVLAGHSFAVPLVSRGITVAVVSGHLPGHLDVPGLAIEVDLELSQAELTSLTTRLDTALLFGELRESATAHERNRMAREMHDGVAQDIASMGYLVDAMAVTAPAELQPDLAQLRAMITRVVAEVRRSVMTLRTQAGSQESLGAGIATLARHLSEVSGVPIQVTVDERTDRLRHEVEAELLRIAQEAMHNAVRHSGAHQVDVECRVDAPSVYLTVRDDGTGLGQARPDSHGLTIMAERAGLIGATLDILQPSAGGTTVRVVLGTVTGPVPSPTLTQKAP